jgi:FkbM family methyltransferase
MGVARELAVDIGGKKYVIASDDDYLDQLRNGFEPHMTRLFGTLVDDGDVVLDIGANIGCTAILFGGMAKRVYAFEPSPSTFTFLLRNVARSGLHNVEIRNIGLGAEAADTTLTFAPSNRSGGFVSDQTKASAGHTVEKIHIEPLDVVLPSLGLSRVDFAKIDVEGFEASVIRGAGQTLSAYRPVVVLELNHWCLNAFQRTSIPDFFDFLRSVFPLLLAVDGESFLDLHDAKDSYVVMYHHILAFRFPNIVAAFDDARLARFHASFRHGFVA